MARDPQDAQWPPGGAAHPGRTVGGRYRLDHVLGRGGMGVVWSGTDSVLGRRVAVKEVAAPGGIAGADDSDLRERTLREARTAARVSADGVVAVYDVVEDEGRLWIVMELLPPRTLEDELRERGGLPPEEVAQIGATLLAGLSAAHAVGVLHRDVKPSNVMFRDRSDGRHAVLVDFGIALSDGDASITATGLMVGSPAYFAPERARGGGATPASDLWSLGVTLWAAVEGRSPFLRENSLASLNAVITEDVPHAVNAGPLAPVLVGLLRKDPTERLDAATAGRMLADALPPPGPPTEQLGVATTQEIPAPDPADPVTTPDHVALPPSLPPAGNPRPAAHSPARRRRGRRSLLAGLATAAVVALLAIGTAVLDPFGGTDDLTQPGPQAPEEAGTPEPESPEDSAEEEPAPEDGDAPDEQPGADSGDDGSGDGDREDQEDQGSRGDGADQEDGDGQAGQEDEGTAAGGDAGSDQAGLAATTADGFERHDDPTGFSVAYPAGWRVERNGPRVYFHDPGSRAYLMVDQTNDPQPDPVADWQRQEPAVADRLENYARIGEIRAVDYRGWEAAEWEFVFGQDQGTRVLNRNVLTSPSQAYALYWSVPSSRWEAMLPVRQEVLASFEPAG